MKGLARVPAIFALLNQKVTMPAIFALSIFALLGEFVCECTFLASIREFRGALILFSHRHVASLSTFVRLYIEGVPRYVLYLLHTPGTLKGLGPCYIRRVRG